MSVTSPPRPPRPRDPLDREELEALVEALIEEARRRARRRRRRIGSAVLLVAGAGIAAFIGFGGRSGGGAGATALARSPGAQSRVANTRAAPPLGNLPGNIVVSTGFAFDPRTPNTVYVAAMGSAPGGRKTRGYVFKTTDGGWHWRSTATTGAGWTRADGLTTDPQHPGTLYAGNVVAVYKTIDGGRSWHPWNRGLFPPPGPLRKQHFGTPGTTSWNRDEGWVTDIVVDPADSSIVYSATDAVRKSSDGGHTWKTVFRPAFRSRRGYVQRIAIAPTRPETIYAMAMDAHDGSASVYKSTDAGATWHATGGPRGVFANGGSWGSALAVDPQHPTTLYVAIGPTVVRTTDAGASWQPITHGLPIPRNVVRALAVDTQRSGTVYAGFYPGGILKTTNGGRTWSRAVSGLSILALAVDPVRPTTIYAAGSDTTHPNEVRILRSTDSGRTWTISP